MSRFPSARRDRTLHENRQVFDNLTIKRFDNLTIEQFDNCFPYRGSVVQMFLYRMVSPAIVRPLTKIVVPLHCLRKTGRRACICRLQKPTLAPSRAAHVHPLELAKRGNSDLHLCVLLCSHLLAPHVVAVDGHDGVDGIEDAAAIDAFVDVEAGTDGIDHEPHPPLFDVLAREHPHGDDGE